MEVKTNPLAETTSAAHDQYRLGLIAGISDDDLKRISQAALEERFVIIPVKKGETFFAPQRKHDYIHEQVYDTFDLILNEPRKQGSVGINGFFAFSSSIASEIYLTKPEAENALCSAGEPEESANEQ